MLTEKTDFGIAIAISNLRKFVSGQPLDLIPTHKPSSRYVEERGLMVIDVVGSVRRRYASQVAGPKGILSRYKQDHADLSLQGVMDTPNPTIGLSEREWKTVRDLAEYFLKFGATHSITNEELIISSWTKSSELDKSTVRKIKGIGPALYNYLQILCGGDTLKVDTRVISSLHTFGLRTDLLNHDGIYYSCGVIAQELSITLLQLDKLLWQHNGLIIQSSSNYVET